MTPVNARQSENKDTEPAAKPAPWKKTVNTPQKPKADDPTDLPLSERFAGWEQRVSQTPTGERGTFGKVVATPKQMCTPSTVVQETGMLGPRYWNFH